MHLFDDLHAFEVVDHQLTPLARGESGLLLMTNLYNYTLPLIRYQTSDTIAIDTERCPCGNSLPILKNLAGRAEDYLWFDAGDIRREFIHPIAFAELFAPGLERFRVVQDSSTAFTIQAKASANREQIAQILSQQVDQILRLKGLTDTVRYQVDFLEELRPNTRSGKFDLIVPQKDLRKPEDRFPPACHEPAPQVHS
jgi:phenylacetate-coenzyme A ligase PaaK-like adenylate-forming protein